MNIRRVMAGVGSIAMIISLGACSNDATPSATATATVTVNPTPNGPIEQFHQAVRKENPNLKFVEDATLNKSGRAVCTYFRKSGVSIETVLAADQTIVQAAPNVYTTKTAAYFIGASAATFCPHIASRLGSLVKNYSDGA